MSQIDDMTAIDRYFGDAQPRTPESVKAKDDWRIWYEGLSWWSKNFDSSTYDEARNRKHLFDEADAVTAEDKAAALNQKQHGLSTEQLEGKTDRRLSDGSYAIPPKPLISTSTKIGLVLVGIVGAVGWVAKKIYLDPFLPRR